MQAERRKKEFTHFLSRGEAYLQSKVLKIVQAEWRKKELVHFLSRGAAYLGPKVKVVQAVQPNAHGTNLSRICPANVL